MYNEADSYCERQMNDRKEQEKQVREKLLEIYENSDEDIKLIISMLIQTEYELAIQKDNYICREINIKSRENNETPNYSKAHNLDEYVKENKELIEKVW